MLEQRARRDLRVPLTECLNQFLVMLPAPVVLVRVRIQHAPADADIALGGPPQCAEDAQIPAGCGRSQQGEVEGVVGVVDLVHRPVRVTELPGLEIQAIQLGIGQQPARALRDLRLQPAPQAVDTLQLIQVERRHQGAPAGPHLHQALILQAPQCLAHRNDADLEHLGQLAQRELTARLQRARQDGPAQFGHDLVSDGPRFDGADHRSRS